MELMNLADKETKKKMRLDEELESGVDKGDNGCEARDCGAERLGCAAREGDGCSGGESTPSVCW